MAAVAVSALFLSSCGNSVYDKGDRMPDVTDADIDTVSYVLGMYFASMVNTVDFGELNLSKMREGFYDVLNDRETRVENSNQVLMMYIQQYLFERSTYLSDKAKEEGEKFLEENKAKEGVVETESGLQYMIVQEGSGISPEPNDTVEINYRGTLVNGEEFDSSYERGETAVLPLNRVIKGWTEGMQYVKEGGRINLYIPYDLAYGQRGTGPIPGYSTLIFEVELVKVRKFNPEASKAAAERK